MFKISLIINSILSVLFIGIVVFNILSEKDISGAADIFAIAYILVVYSVFLWSNFIFFKTNALMQQAPSEAPFPKTGKVLSIIVIILAVVIVVLSLLTLIPFLSSGAPLNSSNLIALFLFVALSLFSAITAIINAVLYRKSVRQNKIIVNNVINDLGMKA